MSHRDKLRSAIAVAVALALPLWIVPALVFRCFRWSGRFAGYRLARRILPDTEAEIAAKREALAVEVEHYREYVRGSTFGKRMMREDMPGLPEGNP